ncbi:PDR/VanB family oxidoreductase [Phytohabitans rumicis]|uniref:Ferredoxin n=1 Tax=Phytohabitans rumicis TaxID=1076125 RepID=A0A6V8KZM6_9ACTN|nr:PDR/VanB family oxidoreductase [Phytohabitans rumicis]GFJ87287.1 ferredoxin [Phytohabitans rumicis]
MTATDLVVARREAVATGVLVLALCRPDGGTLPEWAPGAHLDLVLGPDLVRQYSLCGDPGDRSVLEVAVQLEAGGRGGSRFVHERLAVGGTVRVAGPRNHLPLVDAPRYLFIAGGIGITPIRPMVAAADAAGADWCLAYGGRTRASMAFAEQLHGKYGRRVGLCPQDETGLLDLDTLLDKPVPGTAVYCCGPEPLIAAVEERCRARPPGTLHVERFAPKRVDAGGTAFEVELALSGRTVTVRPDRSILAALEEAGVAVLSSCREGTCGTCETVVLGGVPDHRDSLLTEDERAAGDTMMICVSRARTPRLVLEL